MNYNDFVNLTPDILNKMTIKDLQNTINNFSRTANTRINYINKNVQYTPALESLGKDSKKFGKKYMGEGGWNNVNALRKELSRMWRFMTDKTSTKEGILDYYKSIVQSLNRKNVSVGKIRKNASVGSYAKILNPMFKLWEELKDIDPDYNRRELKYAFFDAIQNGDYKGWSKDKILKDMEMRKEELYRKRIDKMDV